MAPLERLAAVLSGTEEVGVAEELVLRARLDLDADRPREAALQARIALEALLVELDRRARGPSLASHRQPIGDAANAALHGELDEAQRGGGGGGRARDAPGAPPVERPLLIARCTDSHLVTTHSPSVYGRFNAAA